VTNKKGQKCPFFEKTVFDIKNSIMEKYSYAAL
jgi:hypothetical protein